MYYYIINIKHYKSNRSQL